jgi:hypothetical protein
MTGSETPGTFARLGKGTWPISYDGFDFRVMVTLPLEEHHIQVSRAGLNHKAAWEAILRFLGEVHWFQAAKVGYVGGSHSTGVQVEATYRTDRDSFLINFEQQITTARHHTALALFREAMCSDSIFYRFVTLSRIIEMPFPIKTGKREWLEESVQRLETHTAVTLRERKLAVLSNQPLAQWLYDYRHRTSHGHTEDISDPSKYDHWNDIRWANEAMRELAVMAMVNKLGIPGGGPHLPDKAGNYLQPPKDH